MDGSRERLAWIAPIVSLAVYPVLLFRYIDANSATSDEATHLTAGYSYWHRGGDPHLRIPMGHAAAGA